MYIIIGFISVANLSSNKQDILEWIVHISNKETHFPKVRQLLLFIQTVICFLGLK